MIEREKLSAARLLSAPWYHYSCRDSNVEAKQHHSLCAMVFLISSSQAANEAASASSSAAATHHSPTTPSKAPGAAPASVDSPSSSARHVRSERVVADDTLSARRVRCASCFISGGSSGFRLSFDTVTTLCPLNGLSTQWIGARREEKAGGDWTWREGAVTAAQRALLLPFSFLSR